MILSDLRNYLQQRGQATLADLALHFDANPEALRGMLEVWVRKGRVQYRRNTASCGSTCSQCDTASTEIYVWGDEHSVVPTLPGDCIHTNPD